jgi:glycosyltransferase involved in cell wall biosynthesis
MSKLQTRERSPAPDSQPQTKSVLPLDLRPGKTPTASIVMALYNSNDTLTRCLESIVAQDYPAKEIIVIDGGSTDGGIDTLNRFDSQIAHWTSEPDNGIYDAWNKGLAVATGEWVCFLGADDQYSDRHALSAMMAVARDQPDLEFISGRCRLVGDHGETLKEFGRRWTWNEERERHFICHPGSLHRRTLFDRIGGFDIRYRIAADYDLNLRAGSALRAGYVDRIVLLIGAGGVCRTRPLQVISETFRIQRNHPEIGYLRATRNAAILIAERTLFELLRMAGLHHLVRRTLLRTGLMKR